MHPNKRKRWKKALSRVTNLIVEQDENASGQIETMKIRTFSAQKVQTIRYYLFPDYPFSYDNS